MKKFLEFLQNILTKPKSNENKDFENHQSDFTPTPTIPEDLDNISLVEKPKKRGGRPKKN
jgi:hypothetical protein